MGTAIKHLEPERVEPSFVNFDIQAHSRSALSVRVPRCQKLQMSGSGCFIAVPYGNSGQQRVKVRLKSDKIKSEFACELRSR